MALADYKAVKLTQKITPAILNFYLEYNQINVMIRYSKPFANGRIGQDAVVDVNSVLKSFMNSDGTFKATIFSNRQKIWRQDVADGK